MYGPTLPHPFAPYFGDKVLIIHELAGYQRCKILNAKKLNSKVCGINELEISCQRSEKRAALRFPAILPGTSRPPIGMLLLLLRQV
jgi:hypothetical protein